MASHLTMDNSSPQKSIKKPLLLSLIVIKRAKRIIHFATRKGSKVIIVTARQDKMTKNFSKKHLKHRVLISLEVCRASGNIGKETASENKVVIF